MRKMLIRRSNACILITSSFLWWQSINAAEGYAPEPAYSEGAVVYAATGGLRPLLEALRNRVEMLSPAWNNVEDVSQAPGAFHIRMAWLTLDGMVKQFPEPWIAPDERLHAWLLATEGGFDWAATIRLRNQAAAAQIMMSLGGRMEEFDAEGVVGRAIFPGFGNRAFFIAMYNEQLTFGNTAVAVRRVRDWLEGRAFTKAPDGLWIEMDVPLAAAAAHGDLSLETALAAIRTRADAWIDKIIPAPSQTTQGQNQVNESRILWRAIFNMLWHTMEILPEQLRQLERVRWACGGDEQGGFWSEARFIPRQGTALSRRLADELEATAEPVAKMARLPEQTFATASWRARPPTPTALASRRAWIDFLAEAITGRPSSGIDISALLEEGWKRANGDRLFAMVRRQDDSTALMWSRGDAPPETVVSEEVRFWNAFTPLITELMQKRTGRQISIQWDAAAARSPAGLEYYKIAPAAQIFGANPHVDGGYVAMAAGGETLFTTTGDAPALALLEEWAACRPDGDTGFGRRGGFTEAARDLVALNNLRLLWYAPEVLRWLSANIDGGLDIEAKTALRRVETQVGHGTRPWTAGVGARGDGWMARMETSGDGLRETLEAAWLLWTAHAEARRALLYKNLRGVMPELPSGLPPITPRPPLRDDDDF